MNEREKAIIERIKNDLISQGFREDRVVSSSQSGFGDYSSFLELLIDLKLEGKDIPSGEEVFNNIKKQINHAQGLIFHASKEYKKLEMKCKGLEDQLLEKRQQESSLIKQKYSK